nr:FAD-dependent oxidoreductase [Tabrizicola sp. YIM 78059]
MFWDGPGVEVETAHGALRGRAAIVTVSIGVIAFEEIAFTPDLPPGHQESSICRWAFLPRFPCRPKAHGWTWPLFDDVVIEQHARHDLYFLAFPFDLDLLVGFVGGDFAWEMEAAGRAAAVDFVTDRLADTFGSDVWRAVRHGTMTNWGRRPVCPWRLCRSAAGKGRIARRSGGTGWRARLVRGRGAHRLAEAGRRSGAAVGRGCGGADGAMAGVTG